MQLFTTKIEKQFALKFSSIIVTVVGIMIVIMLYFVSTNLKNQANALLEQKVVSLYNQINQRVEFIKENAQLLSNNELIIKSFIDSHDKNSYLIPVIKSFVKGKDIISLSIVDFDGTNIFSTSKKLITYENSKYLRNVLSIGNNSVYIRETDNNLLIITPIKYYDTIQGAIISVYDFKKVIDKFTNNDNNTFVKLLKYDKLIYDYNFDNEKEYYSYNYFPKTINSLSKLDIHMEMGLEESIYNADIESIFKKLLIISMILIIISIILAILLTRNFTNPILKLLTRIQTSTKESIDIKCAPLGTDDELEILANAFDKKTQSIYDLHKKIQNEEFATVFKLSKDGMAIIDLESNFLEFNDAYMELIGYSKQELLTKSCIELSTGVDLKKAKENLQKVIKEGYVKNFEKNCRRKDGTIVTVAMSISLMPDNERLLISTKDITENKKIEQTLLDAKEQAELASKSKSTFLANMSHEIRTPLNAIIGFVDILKQSEKDKQTKEYLEIIDSSSNHLLGVINDILDLSKIESGKLEIEKCDFNTIDEFESIINLFKVKADEGKINFAHFIDNNIPKRLNSDILRIKQVIFNLLSNAIKFTSKDKHVKLHISMKDKRLFVGVEDEGIGIDKKAQSNIFEAFTQENNSTTREYGGTGLGLSISYKLIEMLGGKLQLESEKGKGSHFYFDIPIEQAINSVYKANKDNSIFNKKAHLLLVEDNKANQMFMKVILKKLGLSFEIANDGVEATELYKSNQYDIILMDENMPNMSGIEATKVIRKYEIETKKNYIPIVALTANAIKGDRERFINAGMDEYLTKPLNKQDFIDTLNKLIK